MSTPTNDGGPAFPSGKSETPGYENSLPYYEGLSLRDYFAAKAMSSILMQPERYGRGLQIIAETAFEYADAMLAARNQTTK